MIEIGTPGTPSGRKALLLGSGELGKEVVIELQRYGLTVVACDKYADAPALHVADKAHVFSMLDGETLRKVVEEKKSEEIVKEWIREKQRNTYVRINEDWRGCDFLYPGWIK